MAGSTARGRRRSWTKWLTIVAFVAPALTLFTLLVIYPLFQAVYYSLFNWNGLKPLTDFVGLANYERAFADRTFTAAITHNFAIVVMSLVLQLPFALALALGLNRSMPGRAVFRLTFFAPYVLAEVITAVVWQQLLRPHGFADKTLEAAGLGGLVQEWLADPGVVLLTLFVVISWKYFGLHMVLYLAGLQAIPRELEEAAAIDGANRLQALRFVTLPLLGPTIRISIFLSVIGSLQLFDLVWVTTRGGPVHASNTMATYMFEWGFPRSQLGYGSAVAVILAAVSLVIALGYQRLVLRRDTEGALTTFTG